MTKEELLQKGISPELADEILASFSESPAETSLDALKKAMEKCAPKASLKKSDEDEPSDTEPEEPEDDEEYMKKSQKNLKKAMSGLNFDKGTAYVEMEDLLPVMEKLADFSNSLSKAVSDLRNEVRTLSLQNSNLHELVYNNAGAQIDILESVSAMTKASQGRKGVIAANMSKAEDFSIVDRKSVEEALEKAIRAGNAEAMAVGSKFAAAGSNYARLDAKDKAVIDKILKEERR